MLYERSARLTDLVLTGNSLADFRRDNNNRPWHFTGKIIQQPTQ